MIGIDQPQVPSDGANDGNLDDNNCPWSDNKDEELKSRRQSEASAATAASGTIIIL